MVAPHLDAMIAFRPRLPSDDDYIRALSAGAFHQWAQSGARAVRRLIGERDAITEVAVYDHEPIGFVVVSVAAARAPYGPIQRPVVAHLSAIATDPHARRRGVGRRMLRRAEEIARAEGALCMSLTTAVTNGPARRLFEAAGYLTLAGLAGFYAEGKDAVAMHKDLGL